MILVTTPTGRTGSQILAKLTENGVRTRAFARQPDKIPSELRDKIEIAEGSLLDENDFTKALTGCEAVYFCIPEDNTHDNIPYYEKFARVAAAAIRRAETKRVVFLSGGGKDTDLSAGIVLGLHRAEDILATESGAALRALRCPPFFESLLYQAEPILHAGKFFFPMSGDYKFPQAAASDIAEVAVKWLIRNDWNNIEGVAVHGAADISHRDVAAALSAALGKEVRFQQIPREEYVKILINIGSSPEFAHALTEMFEAIEQGLLNAEPRTPETTTPTTIENWAARVFIGQTADLN